MLPRCGLEGGVWALWVLHWFPPFSLTPYYTASVPSNHNIPLVIEHSQSITFCTIKILRRRICLLWPVARGWECPSSSPICSRTVTWTWSIGWWLSLRGPIGSARYDILFLSCWLFYSLCLGMSKGNYRLYKSFTLYCILFLICIMSLCICPLLRSVFLLAYLYNRHHY